MAKLSSPGEPVMNARSGEPAPRKPLRLWPGVALALLLLVLKLVVPAVTADAGAIAILGGAACALLIVVWWLFFSRAPWPERTGIVILMVGALLVALRLVHMSIRGGMMGMMLPFYAPPVMCVALVAAAVAARHLSDGARRATMIVAILLACGSFTLIRTDGVLSTGSQLAWRWTPTAEERLLAQPGEQPIEQTPARTVAEPSAPLPSETSKEAPATLPSSAASAKKTPVPTDARSDEETSAAAPSPTLETRAEWPGFRGRDRDSVIHGVRIETDWSKSPPTVVWRRAIGPGWSSFAVRGDVLYTQEQRGDDELVAAYSVSTGKPVWRHADPVRFWESNGGAGPRGTPTFSNGRLYTFGATGIVNALDARNGSRIWSRNAGTDTHTEVPGWGFSSSPLVVDDEVIVAASGRLIAYDIATGKPRWLGPPEGGGYSSPHLMTIDGVPQILLARGRRTTSVAPADGSILWEHSGQPSVSIVQPALADDGEILIAAGDAMGGLGTRRIAVTRGSSGWTVEERWTSRGLKPYFNDFIVHKGHAFGFDGNILACIDLADGTRKWKGGRYGNGQLVLLADQDLLLVLSEEGELALVSATPDEFKELARFTALDGKTWNHPALVGDTLLVRNGQEMAAFRLVLAAR